MTPDIYSAGHTNAFSLDSFSAAQLLQCRVPARRAHVRALACARGRANRIYPARQSRRENAPPRTAGRRKSRCYDSRMERSIASLSNEELLAATRDLVRRSCSMEADLLVHLGEIDERKLYLDRAFS